MNKERGKEEEDLVDSRQSIPLASLGYRQEKNKKRKGFLNTLHHPADKDLVSHLVGDCRVGQ